jgi:hypothetical protein
MKIENPARSSGLSPVPDLSPQQVAHPKGNPRPRSQAERHRGPADDCGTPLDRVHGPLLPCKPNAIRFGQAARVSGATKVSCNPFPQPIPTFHRPLSARRGGDHTGGGPRAVCSVHKPRIRPKPPYRRTVAVFPMWPAASWGQSAVPPQSSLGQPALPLAGQRRSRTRRARGALLSPIVGLYASGVS